MKFLFFLILLILLVGGGFIAFYKFQENMTSILKDNHLLKSQLSILRDKYNELLESRKNYLLEFLTVDNQYGLLPMNTNTYLFPDKNAPVLKTLDIGMQAGILEKVVIDDSIWYYVALPLDSNINSRGWVTEDSFSNIASSPTALYKNN